MKTYYFLMNTKEATPFQQHLQYSTTYSILPQIKDEFIMTHVDINQVHYLYLNYIWSLDLVFQRGSATFVLKHLTMDEKQLYLEVLQGMLDYKLWYQLPDWTLLSLALSLRFISKTHSQEIFNVPKAQNTLVSTKQGQNGSCIMTMHQLFLHIKFDLLMN